MFQPANFNENWEVIFQFEPNKKGRFQFSYEKLSIKIFLLFFTQKFVIDF